MRGSGVQGYRFSAMTACGVNAFDYVASIVFEPRHVRGAAGYYIIWTLGCRLSAATSSVDSPRDALSQVSLLAVAGARCRLVEVVSDAIGGVSTQRAAPFRGTLRSAAPLDSCPKHEVTWVVRTGRPLAVRGPSVGPVLDG